VAPGTGYALQVLHALSAKEFDQAQTGVYVSGIRPGLDAFGTAYLPIVYVAGPENYGFGVVGEVLSGNTFAPLFQGADISNGYVYAVGGRGPGVAVTPRIVLAGDENRLTGYTALPIVLNPYLDRFEDPIPVSSATRPAPGSFDLVFDTPSRASAGRFAFRFWIDDVTPPRIRLLDHSARAGGRIRFSIDDGKGSGLELNSVQIQVDGAAQRTKYVAGTHTFFVSGFSRGAHTLQVTAADYQELKNNENVTRILPNTRVFRARFRVR